MRYLKWILPLTLLYIALSSNAEPSNWLLGLLLAAGITALLQPNPSPFVWRKAGTAVLAGARFLLTLLWDLVVSSYQVARMIVTNTEPVNQGIYALPTGSDKTAVSVLSAQAITLTPGEMVVEMDDNGLLYVHSLDMVTSAQSAQAAQKKRVAQLEKMFE